MASLIQNLRGRKAIDLDQPDFAGIDKRVAQNVAATQKAEQREQELYAALGQIAATEPLSDAHKRANAAWREASDDLELLAQARRALDAEREQIAAGHHEALLEQKRQVCAKHVSETEAAGVALSKAASVFIAEYQKMIRAARSAHESVPAGVVVYGLAAGQLREDIAVELFRLAAEASGQSIGRDHQMLPIGAGVNDIGFTDDWEAITPFTDKVRKQAAYFKAALAGEKAE